MRIAGETKTDDNDKPLNSAVYVLTSEPLRFSEIGRPAEDVIKPVGDTFTTPATKDKEDVVVDRWGIPVEAGGNPERPMAVSYVAAMRQTPDETRTGEASTGFDSPFEISENVIYDPPHVSPRIRAQDGVLLACHQPMQPLEEKDYLEIVIKHEAHDDIRQRLDQYGVFDKQLFPDLDGIAKWLKYRVFEIDGKC